MIKIIKKIHRYNYVLLSSKVIDHRSLADVDNNRRWKQQDMRNKNVGCRRWEKNSYQQKIDSYQIDS